MSASENLAGTAASLMFSTSWALSVLACAYDDPTMLTTRVHPPSFMLQNTCTGLPPTLIQYTSSVEAGALSLMSRHDRAGFEALLTPLAAAATAAVAPAPSAWAAVRESHSTGRMCAIHCTLSSDIRDAPQVRTSSVNPSVVTSRALSCTCSATLGAKLTLASSRRIPGAPTNLTPWLWRTILQVRPAVEVEAVVVVVAVEVEAAVEAAVDVEDGDDAAAPAGEPDPAAAGASASFWPSSE
mmetsp:Transcript_14540/g.32627  ORF Transcript_14540/g.32627 Transcript_14540/m.32627 type:complete len:241 (+) Transcript_14540:330-1052(+)